MQSRSARALFALALVLVTAVVASCSSNSGSSAPTPPVSGPTFSLAFPATGTSNKIVINDVGSWAYHCIPHGGQGMVGTINVVASGAVDSALIQVGQNNSFTFSPSTVTINTGGYVRWVNASTNTFTHTATRP
jgi:plastocyanin